MVCKAAEKQAKGVNSWIIYCQSKKRYITGEGATAAKLIAQGFTI
jgi:hypothetical protein